MAVLIIIIIIIIQSLFSFLLVWNKIPDLATSFRNNYDPILRKLRGWL
jgi:hypothetical protein